MGMYPGVGLRPNMLDRGVERLEQKERCCRRATPSLSAEREAPNQLFSQEDPCSPCVRCCHRDLTVSEPLAQQLSPAAPPAALPGAHRLATRV